MVKSYQPDNYEKTHPIIPHGLSVVITAPSVFEFTGPMSPERHLEGARLLGGDVSPQAKAKDAGAILGDVLRDYMRKMKIPDGISSLGYTTADIPSLVKGALGQERVNKLAPRPQSEEDLHGIYEDALSAY